MNTNELGYLKGIAADRLGTSVRILEESEKFLAENEEAIKALFPHTKYYD
jgi:Holliday junction resolvase RusA-like endonuclease